MAYEPNLDPRIQKVLEAELLAFLRLRVGVENAITGTYIDEKFKWRYPETRWDDRIRRYLITQLRLQGHPILSKGGIGYWWPSTRAEANEAIRTEFTGKIDALLKVRKALRRSVFEYFGAQESMF
jgi:hypothetical protein